MDDRVDFAFSYAGEDAHVAEQIAQRLSELRLSIFFAQRNKEFLVGIDGETFFEQLFTRAKQVIVFISKHYRSKMWPRFEWDVILERNVSNRFIPIRLDETKMVGLSNNFIYLRFDGTNYDEIVKTCVKRLLLYEDTHDIHRPSEFDRMVELMRTGSKGSLAKAYQLIADNRDREPLQDAEMPQAPWETNYRVEKLEWPNLSKIKRLVVHVEVPPALSRDELVFNLKHCAITHFNHHKPDVIRVNCYRADLPSTISDKMPNGWVDFAPFGQWERAMDGFAYNMPVSEFDFDVRIFPSYSE